MDKRFARDFSGKGIDLKTPQAFRQCPDWNGAEDPQDVQRVFVFHPFGRWLLSPLRNLVQLGHE